MNKKQREYMAQLHDNLNELAVCVNQEDYLEVNRIIMLIQSNMIDELLDLSDE